MGAQSGIASRPRLKDGEYFVVSSHREENVDVPDQFARLCRVLGGLTGLAWNRIQEALAILEQQDRNQRRTLRIVDDYAVPNVSEKVVRIILSYTDYVNRTVWRKT